MQTHDTRSTFSTPNIDSHRPPDGERPRSDHEVGRPAPLLTLTCPTCGAKLKLSEKVHLLVCANCGNEHMVHRGDGAIYLAPIAADVAHIRTGVDKTAAELAVVRLSKEVAALDVELRNLQESELDQWSPPTLKESITQKIFAVAPFVFFLSVTSQLFFLANIAFLTVIAAGIFYATVRHKRIKAAKKRRKAEISRLTESLQKKHSELQKNRAIAES